MTGIQIAKILTPDSATINVPAARDFYDPVKRIVHLTPETARGGSLNCRAHAAHEACHSIQHRDGRTWWLVYRFWMVASAFLWVIGWMAAIMFLLAGFGFPAVACFAAIPLINLSRAAAVVQMEKEASRMALNWMHASGWSWADCVEARKLLVCNWRTYWRMLLK